MYSRRDMLKWAGVSAMGAALWPSLGTAAAEASPQRPNIVLVLADDLGWWTAGCYGNPDVKTPNLDRLATEGMSFNRAFTCGPICTPSRTCLYTGLDPLRSGVSFNHTAIKDSARSIVHHLRALGYRVGLHGKRHIAPMDSSFPFDKVDQPEAYLKRKGDAPVCLIYASHNPHLPWKKNETYDPAKLTVPPMLVDNAETRAVLCDYYTEASMYDQAVGDCMKWVQETGKADNTVFIATSEQGSTLPGGKYTCFDGGLRTQLVVRWPGKIAAGVRTDALVQYPDILPTLIEIAGGDPTTADAGLPGDPSGGTGLDGRSFLKVLTGQADQHNKVVFGVFEDSSFSVRNGRYRYIVNTDTTVPRPIMRVATSTLRIWQTWLRDARTNEHAAALVKHWKALPAEALYDCETDPHNLKNLVDSPDHQAEKDALKQQLQAWRERLTEIGIKNRSGKKVR